jgi:hypothetical protein
MKAAPPFAPTSVGKRHTLPSPTALPAAARMIPNLLPKLALLLITGAKVLQNERKKKREKRKMSIMHYELRIMH